MSEPNPIVAYAERQSWSTNPETGEPWPIRHEWRVSLVADFSYEVLQAAFGDYWRDSRKGYSSHVLEHRYVRGGVAEEWTLFDTDTSRRGCLEMIDSNAVAVDPELTAIQAERRAAQAEHERKIEADRVASVAAAERAYHAERSDAAFYKLSKSKDSVWAERWNSFVSTCDNATREQIAADRALYDAVMSAETVPAKRKAIKAFLAKWERRAVAA